MRRNTAFPGRPSNRPTRPTAQPPNRRREFELTFLGTASACPSKYRNVTALYCDMFDRGGLLLDCGEDTLGQLARRCGRRARVGHGRARWDTGGTWV